MNPSQREIPSIQRLRILGLALGACASAGLLSAVEPATAAPAFRVRTLATGLENPRGMAIAPDGNLFISEAGRGGSGPCITPRPNITLCYGETGAVGRFDRATNVYTRALANLPSLAVQSSPLFPEGTGLQDLAFDGAGHLYGVFGLGADPNLIPTSVSTVFGQTVAINLATGSMTTRAAIAAHEAAQNPDG